MANQKMKTKRAAAKRFKVTGTGKPVSYTHLDVYKRQGLPLPA